MTEHSNIMALNQPAPQQEASGFQSMLDEARLINGDSMKKHIKCSGFSTNLSGRFYKNGSLESHKLRLTKITALKVRKKELERMIKVEESNLHMLETEFSKKEETFWAALQDFSRFLNGIITLQSIVRKMISYKEVQEIRYQEQLRFSQKSALALYIQKLHRGKQDRKAVNIPRHRIHLRKIEQFHKESSAAVQIQCKIRQVLSISILKEKQNQLFCIRNRAVTKIQCVIRGNIERAIIIEKNMKNERLKLELAAVISLQSFIRGEVDRKYLQSLRKSKEQKKTKLTPKKKSQKIEIASIPGRQATVINTRVRKPSFVVGVPRDTTTTSFVKAALVRETPRIDSSLAYSLSKNNNNKKDEDLNYTKNLMKDKVSLTSSEKGLISPSGAARMKAAQRATETERKIREEKENKVKDAFRIASRIEDLEKKRKLSLRQQERGDKEKSDETDEITSQSCRSSDTTKKDSSSHKILIDTNFEDEFDEEEDDLEL